MPIALLLQFCLATTVPRTLVANHNRHLAIFKSQRHAVSTASIASILSQTATVSTQKTPAATAAAPSFAVWRSIAALAGPLAGNPSNSISKRLCAPPVAVGFRPWAKSAAASGTGAGAGAAPIAPVVTVHHVYADNISAAPSVASSSVSLRSSFSSHSLAPSQGLCAASILREMASSTGMRRRLSAKNSVDESRNDENVVIASASSSSRPTSVSRIEEVVTKSSSSTPLFADMMAPPAPAAPVSREQATRTSRASTASSTASGRHNPNRLSLTLPLPIALPTPEPTRPTPAPSVTSASHPPTPASGSTASNATAATAATWASSDSDPNSFIIAIAAQERRVLELREELALAETELNSLKNKWTRHEGTRKLAVARAVRPGQPSAPQAQTSDDSIAARRSIELDRRRTLLLSQQQQQQQQPGPGSPRRRVIRGGHTRTLSLLSPTKMSDASNNNNSNTFTVPRPGEEVADPLAAGYGIDRRSTDMGTAYRNAEMRKRASWQPRVRPSSAIIVPSNAAAASGGMGMAAIVEDLKQGFRTLATFVDDIRQVTVGDEPITGQTPIRRMPRDEEWGGMATGSSRTSTPDSRLLSSRPRLEPLGPTTSLSSGTETPTKPPRAAKKSLLDDVDPVSDTTSNKAAARKKHFSWAPLEFSNLDAEWASWEPVVPAATADTSSHCANNQARWSGTTATSSGDEFMPMTASPIKTDLDTDVHKSNTLDDLFPTVVKQLSPTNLKRATVDFMDQWEKSLSPTVQAPAVDVRVEDHSDDAGNLISF